jgi:hypothetical protein
LFFGTLAITNKDEFMKGLMSTLQGPLDRLRSAWDQLTQRFEYIMFLFRNLRGDGSGAFAAIATMVGKLAGWIGGILMDAFTSVMTAIQVIFKGVEFLIKLFSGDFTGAIEALKDGFKLLGVFVLEIFLNIADTLVGWIPILGRVIRNSKGVVAEWREGLTSVSQLEQALVDVDKNVRALKKSNQDVAEQYAESLMSMERMAELEIIPMDLIDSLIEKVDGFEIDLMGDVNEQLDELAGTIAEMDEILAKLPPQIQDQVMTHVELHAVLQAQTKLYEEQKILKEQLLGLTNNLTEEENEELDNLKQQTSEMEAQVEVLRMLIAAGGEIKSDPLGARNFTDEMREAADALVAAGKLTKTEGGLGGMLSDVYQLNEASDLFARNFIATYDQMMARRRELDAETHEGMTRRVDEINAEIDAERILLARKEQTYAQALARLGEEHEFTMRARREIEESELRIAALSSGRQDIIDAILKSQQNATDRAAALAKVREAERHLQRMENIKREHEAMLGTLERGSQAWRDQYVEVQDANRLLIRAQQQLNAARAAGQIYNKEEITAAETLGEVLARLRREHSEGRATVRGMKDDPAADAIDSDASSDASSAASSFRSAMSEVMSDIATSFNRVLSEQSKRISDHFSDLRSSAKDYFDDYTQKLTEQTKDIIDQLEQRAQAEEDAINAVADLRIEYIEEQASKERELDELRDRFFRREQARIDYVRSRATADINIREALLRGERGRAAILRIEKELAAQQFYNDILKEREQDIRELRQKAREQEIDLIDQEREEALKANQERIDIEKIAVSETEKRAKEAAKIAEERAQTEIENAEKAAEEAMELEQYRIQQYLREWQKITPATEEEFKKHLAELQKFFDQSNNRLRSEINRIYGDFSVVFNSMSKDFQTTNNDLMSELRKRLTGVENQYLDMNNTILGAIHNTNVEVANSIEDILANIGSSATTTEKILGDARDAFKFSVEGMLDALLISSESTLTAFTEGFIPDFTDNMDWAFGTVNEMGKDFAKVFGNDLEAGFETAMDRAIAALTEEKKWKDAEIKIASYMASIAKHLNINIPTPGQSDPNKDSGKNDKTDPHPFPGVISVGQSGDHVRKVQKALNHFLRNLGMQQISEDGIFGPRTGSALAAVTQRIIGTPMTRVDEKLWNSLKPHFHTGGLVGSMPGSGNKEGLGFDEVSAVLQKGEYVINRRAVSLLGTDFLDRINSTQAKFSSPRGVSGTLRSMNNGSTSSTTNTYNLSFQVDGGNIDEQKLAQKVVFEIKKMERDMGGGRRIS